jgi:fumarate hydratase class II
MQIAAVQEVEGRLLPGLEGLGAALERKAGEFRGLVKVGRTHLQDAVPLPLSAEVSAWAAQVSSSLRRVRSSLPALLALPLGGTAVGTVRPPRSTARSLLFTHRFSLFSLFSLSQGLNAYEGWAEWVAEEIAQETGQPFYTAPNKVTLGKDASGQVKLWS